MIQNTRGPQRGSRKGLSTKNDYVANIRPAEHVSDPLTGQYVRDGGKLTGPCTLLLVRRSTTTNAKTSSYVLRVTSDGRRAYVSSLWEGPYPDQYALEYKGRRYTLTIAHDTAEVVPVTSSTVSTNVHVHQ